MTYLPKNISLGFSEILEEELYKDIIYTKTGLPKVLHLDSVYNVRNFNNTGQAHSFAFVDDNNKGDFMLFTSEHNITKAVCGDQSNLFPIVIDTNIYDALTHTDKIEINNFAQLDEFLARGDKPVLVCGHWSHKDSTSYYVTKAVLASPQTMGEALNLIV